MWDTKGAKIASVASLPLADTVPVHNLAEGPRGVAWQATAPHTLYWIEALDGGDPVAEVPHRDRLMRLDDPFAGEPSEVWRAQHRIVDWSWAEDDDTMMLVEHERMRRWLTTPKRRSRTPSRSGSPTPTASA